MREIEEGDHFDVVSLALRQVHANVPQQSVCRVAQYNAPSDCPVTLCDKRWEAKWMDRLDVQSRPREARLPSSFVQCRNAPSPLSVVAWPVLCGDASPSRGCLRVLVVIEGRRK